MVDWPGMRSESLNAGSPEGWLPGGSANAALGAGGRSPNDSAEYSWHTAPPRRQHATGRPT